MAKKAVVFKAKSGGYNIGETAGFDEDVADELVRKGVADYHKAVPHQTQNKAAGGEGAPLPNSSRTTRTAQSSSRGPGRPSKKTSSTTFASDETNGETSGSSS